jgi:hypothetical protein
MTNTAFLILFMFASLLIQGFLFASRLRTNLPPVASARDLFFIHSNAKYTGVPSGAASGTNSRHLPISGGEFMDTSPSTPFVVQIGSAWLTCLAGWSPLTSPAMSVDVKIADALIEHLRGAIRSSGSITA